ncbi:MAG TPA: hypothetical protein VGN12_05210 [Pirellulales bacterium]
MPLAFSVYADPIWEDSFITLRHSENFLRGEGLVFHPGERIHGFTSPINVLLLALASFVTGQSSFVFTIWLYRLMCIAAFAGGVALVVRRLWHETPAHPLVCAGAFALLYIFDLKAVSFTANGMETAFMLLFLAGAVSLLLQDDPQPWLARGLYWAGLMWSRPDGCIYIGALAIADLTYRSESRYELLKSLCKSGLVCAVVYLPWFAGAWWYYGTPVPHTVIAKSRVEIGPATFAIYALENFFLRFNDIIDLTYQPIYGWFECLSFNDRFAAWLLNLLSRSAGLFSVMYWLFPVKDRLGRAASFSFLLVTLYFTMMMIYVWPWYIPPAALLSMVALCRGIVTLSDAALRRAERPTASRLHPVAATVLVAFIAGQVVMCGWNAIHTRIRQTEIEMGNRFEIGMWLREHGRPDESVYLEPLGYIGYFSGMRMIDWPGLVAPQVVELRRERELDQLGMIFAIHPDWVVLRNTEYDELGQRLEPFLEEYSLEMIFDVSENLRAYGYRPSRLFMDARFGVFRRRDLRPSDFPS